MKDIILFGSTGSVGKSVLDVVRHFPDKYRIKAVAAYANVDLLAAQAAEFKPDFVSIGKKELKGDLENRVPPGVKVLAGEESLVNLAKDEPADVVFLSISGTAALKPLLAALESGRKVALASKEPIVSAGEMISKIIKTSSSLILPVDSEHSAVMDCLGGRSSEDIRTVYITGSGGPLKDRKKEDFETLTIEEVLDHPKWNMGPKITVDSATLMNKGLEVIEAKWLFDVPAEKIKVLVHPEAIIHSMVEFQDGTIRASLYYPDMKFPVVKALSYPDIDTNDFPRVNFSELKQLTFHDPDMSKFPALALAYSVLEEGGTVPAVLNGANEKAVSLFLEGKIKFTNIIPFVEKVIEKHKKIKDPSIEEIIKAEKWAAEEVLGFC